jgi:hypothetical protein
MSKKAAMNDATMVAILRLDFVSKTYQVKLLLRITKRLRGVAEFADMDILTILNLSTVPERNPLEASMSLP